MIGVDWRTTTVVLHDALGQSKVVKTDRDSGACCRMITQSADGRGRRAPYGGRGRGRADMSGRGRGQRQPVSNGEGRGQSGPQWQEPSLGQPAQAALNDAPPPGFLLDSGSAMQGVVVALLDSYGFIRCVSLPVKLSADSRDSSEAAS